MSAVKVKERPIIFSAEMIQAILRGEKTQTRRVIKPQFDDEVPLDMGGWWIVDHPARDIRCPYGQPGERLWCREVWYRPTTFWIPKGNWKRGGQAVVGYPDAPESRTVEIDRELYDKICSMSPGKTSPRFMPRWASRLTLEITDVRVERLQEISEADAIAEGFPKPDAIDAGRWLNGSICVDRFARKWDSLNSKRGFGWDVNPWVWVVSFKRIEVPNV